ncbi:porin [Aminobacter aminovorans]|uniref:porin n=1 Tax=Aminobacter aminovorans TaxID=83263 RepID=UPI00285DA9C9|nr:porin [Aminobacter aminovorans]MDR7222687.1 opacity protein-like surface antigen [Aminobacter aminovorans]
MNIKSLLLGSAAALLAVSGARAADAVVVAEPEPMEYVRICDVYGAGFYYIPGTETCLKIGGLVRYQIDFNNDELGELTGDPALDDGWNKGVLARLKFDARSETEYGTFKRYIEIQATTGGTTLRHGYFELGGLLVGHTDTLFDGDIDGEFDIAGGARVNQIRYTFDAGNGIAVSVGTEVAVNNDSYVPNIVGKVSVAQGWGGVDLFAAYDSVVEEYALKAIANVKATDALTLQVLATYASDYSFFSPAFDSGLSYEWSLGGYLKYAVNDKLSIGAGGQYLAEEFSTSGDDWTIGAVVDYKVVENLNAKLAVNYTDGDNFTDGVTSGFLRLDASF